MNYTLLIFMVMLSIPGFALDEKVIVQGLDETVDLSGLDQKAYDTRSTIRSPGAPQVELPPTTLRDKAFELAGLADDTKSWDELDRDFLYLSAGTSTVEELQKKYPKLPADGLKKLKAHRGEQK